MQNPDRSFGEDNSDLIRSFIRTCDLQGNYEVWAPYTYHGVTGFVDLVVESESNISIFKFLKSAKRIEKAVKNLKLETMFYKKSRSQESKNVSPYLVVMDNKRNRKAVFYHYSLLAEQPFEILFLNKGKQTIESVSEMKENIPRLFQTKKIKLGNDALKKLISNPNHEQIQRTILDSEDIPDVITGELIEKIDRYLKANEKPPGNITSLNNGPKYTGSYKTSSEKDSLDEVKLKE